MTEVRRPDWYPDWSGHAAAIVGSGLSATREAVALLRGRVRVLVINTSYNLAPWADVLYACDAKWWSWHKGALDFVGIRVTHDEGAAKEFGLHRVALIEGNADDPKLSFIPGVIGRGGNSGFQAFNLVLQFGAKPIALLGLDYCGRRWHGPHPNGREQSAQTLAKWAATFDAAAPQAKAFGAEVINLSQQSALKAFPKLSIADALAKWGL